ncbi:MAG: hypothetical protein JNK39_08150 [Nitrosomonas sp.]|nr:hypothetical protein [Nitrosomonas sp.]
MKAMAILATIFSLIAAVLPYYGAMLSMVCSVMLMITFRTHQTTSSIMLIFNIVTTMFLSPFMLFANDILGPSPIYNVNEVFAASLSTHLFCFVMGLGNRLLFGKVKPEPTEVRVVYVDKNGNPIVGAPLPSRGVIDQSDSQQFTTQPHDRIEPR